MYSTVRKRFKNETLKVLWTSNNSAAVQKLEIFRLLRQNAAFFMYHFELDDF